MSSCPACGTQVPDSVADCPSCRLSVALFPAVREAAGPDGAGNPVFMQTVGELIQSVDLLGPASEPGPTPRPGLLDRTSLHHRRDGPADRPRREAEPLKPLDQMPSLPALGPPDEVRHRIDELTQLARRIGVDLGSVPGRVKPAVLAGDAATLATLARELFVRLAGAVAEEYETELARRNDLAHLAPTPSADVELDAVRAAIAVGDLVGAQRRLEHVRDELARIDEEWAAGRFLATECDLLADTLRDLGGDPQPALGPLEEGRRNLVTGQRENAERLLARAAMALWALLEPRFFEDLKRLRERLVSVRTAGVDVGPAVAALRGVATELKARNFAGAISAYRQLKRFLEQVELPGSVGPLEVVSGPTRPSPSA